MTLVADCPKCHGAKCFDCKWRGWVYLFRSLEGDILYGVTALLRRRKEREET